MHERLLTREPRLTFKIQVLVGDQSYTVQVANIVFLLGLTHLEFGTGKMYSKIFTLNYIVKHPDKQNIFTLSGIGWFLLCRGPSWLPPAWSQWCWSVLSRSDIILV